MAQAFGKDRGQLVNAVGDLRQATRAVIHGVHAGDVGQQHLRGADVAGGLLATNVLFAGLHGKAQGLFAVAIHRHADQTARHVTFERIARREISRMRAAEAQRYAKALCAADGYVSTEFTRRGQQGQGQQVGGDGHQCVGTVKALDQFAVVEYVAITGRVLQQRTKVVADIAQLGFIGHHNSDAQRLGAGAQHIECLRVAVAGGEELLAAFVLAQALAECHRFGGSSGFVEQRGIGNRQAGQVADQGLEIEQRLQTALGNLWLVGRVGGVPGRVFQQVAQDRGGCVGVVVTLADVGLEQLVLAGDGLDGGQCIGFTLPGRQVQHAGALDAFRDHAVAQRFNGVETQGLQHGQLVSGTRADVAGNEFVGGGQFNAVSHGSLLRLGHWL